MASDKKVRVAIVGLGFGAEFIPIYQNHPDAEMYAICRREQGRARRVRRPVRHQGRATPTIDELLKDPNVDAVHINSPDPRPRPAVDRGPEGRQARRLHRADGHHRSTSAGRSSRPSGRAARST